MLVSMCRECVMLVSMCRGCAMLIRMCRECVIVALIAPKYQQELFTAGCL